MLATPDLYEAENQGAVINNYGGCVQSAVLEFDGFKLGSEVEAEAHDVRLDKTKVDERLRYAAEQAAGGQAQKPYSYC